MSGFNPDVEKTAQPGVCRYLTPRPRVPPEVTWTWSRTYRCFSWSTTGYSSPAGSDPSRMHQFDRAADRGLRVSGRSSEYADVTDMFRHLKSLDEESAAFRRHRDAIVEQALPVADHIARRYMNRGEPHDDLVQAARVGLVNAVNRFDVETGSDFLSFAVPTMMGEVRRHFRDHGWAVKVPRRLKDLQSSSFRRAVSCRRARASTNSVRARGASRARPRIGRPGVDRRR